MYYVIADILDAGGIAAARETLAGAKFVDGRATAGWHAKLVKRNLQASGADKAIADLRATLAAKISDHQLFRLAARPKALTPLILSRYEPGMEYGTHVDDALMNGMRTDVSFTLFLSDPESYEGGALVIESTGGEEDVKLPAGSLVAYRFDDAPPRRAGHARAFASLPSAGHGASSATRRSARCSSTSTRPVSTFSSGRARRRTSTSCRRRAPTCSGCGPRTEPPRLHPEPHRWRQPTNSKN